MTGWEQTVHRGEEIGVLPAGHKKRVVEWTFRRLCFV